MAKGNSQAEQPQKTEKAEQPQRSERFRLVRNNRAKVIKCTGTRPKADRKSNPNPEAVKARFAPGVNAVKAEIWDALRSTDYVQGLMRRQGRKPPALEEVQAPASDGGGAKPSGPHEMNAEDARSVIAETFEPALLQQFREQEAAGKNRKQVLAAIDEHEKKLSEANSEEEL